MRVVDERSSPRLAPKKMVSSDDDRDAGLKFGFRAQQRMRERERREKSKDERKKREREADEEREMVKDVAKRIAEGDLRARVLAKVAEQLKTDEVQARLIEQVDTAQAATRKVCRARLLGCDVWVGGTLKPRRALWQARLSAVEEEGDEAVRDAKRKEDERLSEDANTADILAENARLVAEAQRRANSGVG